MADISERQSAKQIIQGQFAGNQEIKPEAKIENIAGAAKEALEAQTSTTVKPVDKSLSDNEENITELQNRPLTELLQPEIENETTSISPNEEIAQSSQTKTKQKSRGRKFLPLINAGIEYLINDFIIGAGLSLTAFGFTSTIGAAATVVGLLATPFTFIIMLVGLILLVSGVIIKFIFSIVVWKTSKNVSFPAKLILEIFNWISFGYFPGNFIIRILNLRKKKVL